MRRVRGPPWLPLEIPEPGFDLGCRRKTGTQTSTARRRSLVGGRSADLVEKDNKRIESESEDAGGKRCCATLRCPSPFIDVPKGYARRA
jgi:hypothetical protein